MTVSDALTQQPLPGSTHLAFRGDVFLFRLKVSDNAEGTAWLRTNIGNVRIARQETIRRVDQNEARLHQDWTDLRMAPSAAGEFELRVPLCENGHFEAKTYFLPADNGQPVWPRGVNTEINVEPAETASGNIVYNAFVRQFGPNKEKRRVPPAGVDLSTLDKHGFTVIPPSGKFRDLIKELDFIICELGCRYIQLLPVYPAPTTYGRMGRFGSPYAAQSFTAIDPALAEFDPGKTPLEQFMELVDAIHSRRARIILDIAINHTGWGAAIHETHPHWLRRADDGKIQMPGAWGVTWEDLARLDYSHKDLWQYMAEVFLVWCRRGVDGFRCDAGYMIPVEAWKYIVARVREEFPDTIFFLEGLGGKISVTREILNKAGFNWAYSELFQNYDSHQVNGYLPLADEISLSDGIMVHFAETHDNNRLASVSKQYATMRTSLCALLCRAGGFAFANGVEWFATEKINVHDAPSLNWGAEENHVKHIRRLAALLKRHPVFTRTDSEQSLVTAGPGNFIAVLRHDPKDKKSLVVIINLEHAQQTTARWKVRPEILRTESFCDLITGEQVNADILPDGTFEKSLDPGQALCLSTDPADLELLEKPGENLPADTVSGMHQRLMASALEVFVHYHGTVHTGDFDPDAAAVQLRRDPEGFCRIMNPENQESRVISWQWPRDLKREVMIPPGHFLLISSPFYFRARLDDEEQTVYTGYGIPCEDNSYFLIIPPGPAPDTHRQKILKTAVYQKNGVLRESASLLYLAPHDRVFVKRELSRQELISRHFMFLGTNGRGAMMRAATYPRRMRSRYDALLAANPDENMPVDRWIMLARCRVWVVYQDYSQALRTDCLQKFMFNYDNRASWLYMIPTGLGRHIMLSVEAEMIEDENRVRILYRRHGREKPEQLEDGLGIDVIIRPDMENRSFHETIKAYAGPEYSWPQAVYPRKHGFSFQPDPEHTLEMELAGAQFVYEPEWTYMEHRPAEAERGLDPDSDLFSPGYFRAKITGNMCLTLEATTEKTGKSPKKQIPSAGRTWVTEPGPVSVTEAMQKAMKHYLVRRGQYKSVIAGYPWFLDWGRDSIIFCRALIEDRSYNEALSVIRLFGGFEKNGTLPNMIRGEKPLNRDTSDAPLWLMIACRDLASAPQTPDFLDKPAGDRTLRQILFSIAASYAKGTENGIRMDPDSGLIFSPAHFTWMDTNFPAATPRQGYPVEIQALWHAGLLFLAQLKRPPEIDAEFDPVNISEKVADSIKKYYFNTKRGFLSDCLHCNPQTPAARAEPDDALRPNQLLAVTMEAVSDKNICASVLASCEELLVPGAIRSLADRRVDRPIEIRHHGNLLGDPYYPYRRRYDGDEDTGRKPAYHNGTAWTWLFPSFCEAWAKFYGDAAKPAALARLGSAVRLINQGCLGHVPEITDGDAPHLQRGCDAQAWGASELLRVWKKLSE
ncbi:MAG: glycogen debranching enzyme N-terminal domain-containing protein [Desulfobacteraceae bacterium]|nr:glycogen debranching enzyme N-terminal domain-containing protein [Desulfobacteraceae bacterium]